MPQTDVTQNTLRIASTPDGVKIFHGTIDKNRSLVSSDSSLCLDSRRHEYPYADTGDKRNI